MNLYDLLIKDHEAVLKLTDELVAAEDSKERSLLVTEIKEALIPHSRAEEWVLYNLLRDLDESKDVVMHSYGEHVKAEALLRGLQLTEAVALKWKAGAEKFREELNHHIEEEQSKVFAAAKRVLSEQEAVMLGKAFQEMKAKAKSGFLASQFELMVNLMPQRFRTNFLKHLKEDQANQKQAS